MTGSVSNSGRTVRDISWAVLGATRKPGSTGVMTAGDIVAVL
jgi:hypothetical protein